MELAERVRHGSFRAVAGIFVALSATCLSPQAMAQDASGETAPSCDRACLTSLMDGYIEALSAADPTGLPVTANLKVTEDSREIALGEGLWQSVTGTGVFRQD